MPGQDFWTPLLMALGAGMQTGGQGLMMLDQQRRADEERKRKEQMQAAQQTEAQSRQDSQGRASLLMDMVKNDIMPKNAPTVQNSVDGSSAFGRIARAGRQAEIGDTQPFGGDVALPYGLGQASDYVVRRPFEMPEQPAQRAPIWDSERGGFVSPQGFQPVPGLPARPTKPVEPPKPEPGQLATDSQGRGVLVDRVTGQSRPVISPDGAGQINLRQPAPRPQTLVEAEKALADVKGALSRYKTIFQRTGREVGWGKGRARLLSEYTNLIGALKGPAIHALGVLAGPDMALIAQQFSNPTDFGPMDIIRGKGHIEAQIEQLEAMLASKEANLRAAYEQHDSRSGYRPENPY